MCFFDKEVWLQHYLEILECRSYHQLKLCVQREMFSMAFKMSNKNATNRKYFKTHKSFLRNDHLTANKNRIVEILNTILILDNP